MSIQSHLQKYLGDKNTILMERVNEMDDKQRNKLYMFLNRQDYDDETKDVFMHLAYLTYLKSKNEKNRRKNYSLCDDIKKVADKIANYALKTENQGVCDGLGSVAVSISGMEELEEIIILLCMWAFKYGEDYCVNKLIDHFC